MPNREDPTSLSSWWLSLGCLGHGGSWLGGFCERERERERDELNIGI